MYAAHLPVRMLTKALAQATSAARKEMDAVSQQSPIEYATEEAGGESARLLRDGTAGQPHPFVLRADASLEELEDEVDYRGDGRRNVLSLRAGSPMGHAVDQPPAGQARRQMTRGRTVAASP
jgi:hypothetical protein